MRPEIHAARRARVLERLGGGVLVLPAARMQRRNGDVEHVFRQESDLLYLSGFPEPDAWLVLHPAAAKPFTLFVRPHDKEKEVWDGVRAGVEGAQRDFGADQAFVLDELDKQMPGLLWGASTLHWPMGLDRAADERVLGWLAAARRKHRDGVVAPECVRDPGLLLGELRILKDSEELELLREACGLAEKGFRRALAACRPGVREYELEAEIGYEFRRGGGVHGFEPIVAGGVRATTLHGTVTEEALRDGELVLADCGCERRGYTSDVTRTFPVNGRFSAPQRELYSLVLRAHDDAVAAARPGATLDELHAIAVRVLVDGLLRLGFMEGTADERIADKAFRRWYMHRTSHWLGLDAHDAGAYLACGTARPLAPGMVFTVEPGLYIAADDDKAPPEMRGTGIRIEDDLLITDAGCEVLTEAIPRGVDEVERAMAHPAQ